MRLLPALLGLFSLLLSCRKPEPDPVRPPDCLITCNDPVIKLKLPHSGSELQGMWMIRHTNNYTVHDTVYTGPREMLDVGPWVDYEIILPAVPANIVVGGINISEREIDAPCGTQCVKPVTGAGLFYNWSARAYSIKLNGEKEYVISME